MKSYLTFLSRNKGYTLINVLGLSLSMMFVILIGIYTWQEYHVNSQYPKADRMLVYGFDLEYNGQVEHCSVGHWQLQKHLKAHYPEIESSCCLSEVYSSYTDSQGKTVRESTLFTDSTFLSIFDIPMILGDQQTALNDRDAAIVTDKFARRWFGSPEAAMGKRIALEDSIPLHITGVIHQFNHSSIPHEIDVITRYEHVGMYNYGLVMESMNSFNDQSLIILQKEGAHLEEKTADMDKFQQSFLWIFKPDKSMTCHTTLTPLSKYYFTKFDSGSILETGNKTLVNMLLVMGLVILLFAVFNYVNLTNAISDKRSREMAMRQLVGATHRQVVMRLITESVLLCAFSMIIATGLSLAAAPYTNSLLKSHLDLSLLYSPGGIAVIIVFTLLLGVIAGLLPATVISRAKPIDIVRGSEQFHIKHSIFKIGTKGLFIVIQNTITILLIAASTSFYSQIRYLINAPRGYNTHNLIDVKLSGGDEKSMDAWYNGLKRLPQVIDATACCGTPYSGGSNNTFMHNGRNISTQLILGDSHFMKIFGLKVESRTGLKVDWSKTSADPSQQPKECFVNRQMLSDEGLPMNSRYFLTTLNTNTNGPRKENLSGILKDFTIREIGNSQHPIALYIMNDNIRNIQWETVIEVQGDPVTAYKSIQKLYQTIFKEQLDSDHPFIDQQIESDYEEQLRMVKILNIFAIITIIISALGLVAMSTYYIDRHRKEIAIRKVFGSTSSEVSRRLIRQFLSYVAIAFVIAVPLFFWLVGSWMEQYSYRAVWWPWIIAAGLVVLVISLLAVFFQSRRAARQTPSKNLKAE